MKDKITNEIWIKNKIERLKKDYEYYMDKLNTLKIEASMYGLDFEKNKE